MNFISFEGCDYAGKSTQIKLLADFLTANGRKVYLTREPGGSVLAEKIRSILLSSVDVQDPLTEYLLLAAARKDHVDNVIRPYLDKSYYVLSDRFIDSSLCYQGHIKGLCLKTIKLIEKLIISDFQPDITILLTLSKSELNRRINKERVEQNSYDKKDCKFHLNVQEMFLKIAAQHNKRFVTVKTTNDKEIAHKKIKEILIKKSVY